jgi:folylpolyglutamate synthase/dihydropteroate synthase
MVSVRERIRVNGNPLSEEIFAQFFFEVWDALDANTKVWLFCLYSVVHGLRFIAEKESGHTSQTDVFSVYDSRRISCFHQAQGDFLF